jgi:hypothetical protein
MRINHTLLALVGVAGLAFMAGRLDLGPDATAIAGPQDEEMTPEMEAMAKAGMPGKHHRLLASMTGKWEAHFKIRPTRDAPMMEMPGAVEREMVLDGRYLREEVTSTSEWGTFRGIGYVGFDQMDGVFQGIWMDSMSTAILNSTGTYDPDEKVMTMHSTHREPLTGRLVHTKGKFEMSSRDRHVYKEWVTDADGRWYQSFEGVMERAQ